MPLKYACFISYRHGQNKLIERIIDDLSEALANELDLYFENTVYLDRERLKGGAYLDKQIAQALCESVCLIVVYIPRYLDPEHPYCVREFCAMEQLEKMRFESLTIGADKSNSLIIPIIFRGKNDVPDELIGDRIYYLFEDFDTTKPKMYKTRRYNDDIKKIATYIYERFKLLSSLPVDPCNRCEDFELPKADADAVKKLLKISIQPFPTREGVG